MTKINSIYLRGLRNNEHYQFMADFNKLVNNYQASELMIDNYIADFQSYFAEEDDAISIIQGSLKSSGLDEIDSQRDKTWKAIYDKVRATLSSPIDEEVESAKRILRIIDSYGDIRSISYNEESAALTNLIQDLQKENMQDDLSIIGINSWVGVLNTQNNQFQTLFTERNNELATKESGNVRSIRIKIDEVYKKIIEHINATIVIGIAKEIVPDFVNEQNELIDYYKTTLAHRRSGKKEETKETV